MKKINVVCVSFFIQRNIYVVSEQSRIKKKPKTVYRKAMDKVRNLEGDVTAIVKLIGYAIFLYGLLKAIGVW